MAERLQTSYKAGETDVQTEEHVYRHGPRTENQWETCQRCNADDHSCPGCGEWLYHGTGCCGDCAKL